MTCLDITHRVHVHVHGKAKRLGFKASTFRGLREWIYVGRYVTALWVSSNKRRKSKNDPTKQNQVSQRTDKQNLGGGKKSPGGL